MASDWEHLESATLVGGGVAAVSHIPIPNSNGLTVGLRTLDAHWGNPSARADFATLMRELGLDKRPPNTLGSTSVLFVQSADGKKYLRLDWGIKNDGTITYHWNRKKIPLKYTGVTNHSDASSFFRGSARVLRVYRHAGRGMLIVAVALDAHAIYVASNKPLAVSRVVAGWGGAILGCRIVGQGGAMAGGAIGSTGAGVGAAPGAAIGAIGGCLLGGIGGYWSGSELGELTYRWAENTFFTPVPRGELEDSFSK